MYLYITKLHSLNYNYGDFFVELVDLFYNYVESLKGKKIGLFYNVIPFANPNRHQMHAQNKMFKNNTVQNLIKRMMRIDLKRHYVSNLKFMLDTFSSDPNRVGSIPISL